jgi:predicted GIY-YIG superfamily endonuclease
MSKEILRIYNTSIYTDKYYLYILKLKDENTYKFGITTNMTRRMYTHHIELPVSSIVKVIKCESKEIMHETERALKNYARYNNILCKMYHKTEIIVTDDINKIITLIETFMNKLVAHDYINLTKNRGLITITYCNNITTVIYRETGEHKIFRDNLHTI